MTGGDRKDNMDIITSTSNAKIKNIIKCMKNAKERKKQDIFLVEGIRMFSEIPENLHVETFATEKFYQQHAELFHGKKYELVSEHVMDVIADTKTPQGVISIVKRLHYTLEDVCAGKNPLVMALENIQDPGNLGTIVRTGEGAGVTGIILSRDTVDIYNMKVVRSTMGSIFRMPFFYVENLTQVMEQLNKEGYQTYSAHLQGKNFYDYDYRKPTIFCIGNEGNGLSKQLCEVTKSKIWIPMLGKVESLNAATAATVLMYEAMRQRR